MMPYLFYLLVYCIYANKVNPNKHLGGSYVSADFIFKVILFLISIYFLKNELT